MSNVSVSLNRFVDKIKRTVKEAVGPSAKLALGKEAVKIIVRRTRLGYGVNQELGSRSRLKILSEKYIEQRRRYRKTGYLSKTTQPAKSNLTLTGQMLDSVTFKQVGRRLLIQPSKSSRFDTDATNYDIATYQAEQGRVFMNVSQNEFNQLLRFYRKNFGDLLRLRKLIS